MFSSIYHKLYISFLGTFLLTVLIVVALSSHFYGSTLRAGLEDAFLSQARFLRNQYVEACGGGGGNSLTPDSAGDCARFLDRLGRVRALRFWVLDPTGRVVASSQKDPPGVPPPDLRRALGGEDVAFFDNHTPPRAVLPVFDSRGRVMELLVMERSFWRMGRALHFPLFFSLLVAGLVAALLVLPLSRHITRPVRELHERGLEWSEGRLEKRANVAGKDEIAELAAVFNRMADNLQKIMQQRKEFLALISHEMKSPLARLRISLELLSERCSSPGGREVAGLVAGMQEDISDSEKLIDQLLFLSRAEMTREADPAGPIDPVPVVREVMEQASPVAAAAGVGLDFRQPAEAGRAGGARAEEEEEAAPPPPRVLAHPDQLRTAIWNVVDNAVKFSPAGGRVDVALQRCPAGPGGGGGGGWEITVADQGPGIPPEELDRVFEPFYRVRTREARRGSGLGLFIARRMVEAAGGTIRARANNPAGTVVTIQLKAPA